MINNIEDPELASSKTVALRTPDGIAGRSTVSLSVRGINNILQSSDANFNITFDANGSASTSLPVTF